MAASDVLIAADFLDEDGINAAFQNIINLEQQMITLTEQVGQKTASALQGMQIPQTAQDVEKLGTAWRGATSNTKAYAEVLQTTKEANRQVREGIIETKSAYGALEVQTKQATRAAQEAMAADIAAGRAYSQKTLQMISDANALTVKIQSVHQALGNYRDQVGNYSNAIHDALNKSARDWRGLYTSIRALRGATYLLGDALGISYTKINAFRLGVEHTAQAVAFFKQRQADAIKTTEAAKSATEANTVAQAANTTVELENASAMEIMQAAQVDQVVANEALAASNAEVGVSWSLWAGWIGAAVIALAAIGVAIYEYVSNAKTEKEINDAISDGLKKQVDLYKQLYDAKEKLMTITGQQSEQEEKLAKLQTEYEIDKANRAIEAQAAIIKALGEAPKVETVNEYDENGHVVNTYQKGVEELEKYTEQAARIQKIYDDAQAAADKAYYDKKTILRLDDAKEAEKIEDEATEAKNKRRGLQGELDNLDLKEKEEKVGKSEDVQNAIHDKYVQLRINAIEEFNNKSDKVADKSEEHQEKLFEKELEAYRKMWEEKLKIANNINPNPEDANKKFDEETLKQDVEAAKNRVDRFKANGASPQDITNAELDEEDAKFKLLQKQREDAHLKFQADEKNSQQAKSDELYLYARQIELDTEAHENKLAEIKKKAADAQAKAEAKAKKEELKKAKDHSKSLISELESQWKKLLNIRKENEEAQRALTKEQEDAAEKQFEAGRQNQLSALQRKDAQQLAQLQQQGRTEQSEMDFISQFISLMNTNFASMPSHYEGTPDTGNGGDLDNKGGFAAILHPKEAVIPSKSNIPEISKAYIKGDYEAMANMLPTLKIKSDISYERQLNDIVTHQKLDELKDAIKGQPFVEPVYETDREAVRIVYREGKKETIVTRKYVTPNPKNPGR